MFTTNLIVDENPRLQDHSVSFIDDAGDDSDTHAGCPLKGLAIPETIPNRGRPAGGKHAPSWRRSARVVWSCVEGSNRLPRRGPSDCGFEDPQSRFGGKDPSNRSSTADFSCRGTGRPGRVHALSHRPSSYGSIVRQPCGRREEVPPPGILRERFVAGLPTGPAIPALTRGATNFPFSPGWCQEDAMPRHRSPRYPPRTSAAGIGDDRQARRSGPGGSTSPEPTFPPVPHAVPVRRTRNI